MEETTTVGQIMVPVQDVISQNEDVRVARRRLESEAKRSLIVVDGDTPVGVLEWRQLMRSTEDESEISVSQVMTKEVPELTANMTIAEASGRLGDVDVTMLPVIDSDGHLIGEVPRSAILRREEVVQQAQMSASSTAAGSESMAPTFPSLATGMTVAGAAGSKLGEVSDLVMGASGQLDAIIVSHGLFGRKHKRVAADVISDVDADKVTLAIDQPEFKALPDLEHVEERV